MNLASYSINCDKTSQSTVNNMIITPKEELYLDTAGNLPRCKTLFKKAIPAIEKKIKELTDALPKTSNYRIVNSKRREWKIVERKNTVEVYKKALSKINTLQERKAEVWIGL